MINRAEALSITVICDGDSRIASVIRDQHLAGVEIVPTQAAGSASPDLLIIETDPSTAAEILVSRVDRGIKDPVLVVVADDRVAERMIASGARDVLSRTSGDGVIATRIKNLLHDISLQNGLSDQHTVLKHERDQARELFREAHLEVLRVVIDLAEYRDDDTKRHTRRVGDTSAMIAQHIGLSSELVEHIHLAAPMHDIGKVAVPDAVLLKNGPLTDEEMREVQTHSVVGARVTWGRKMPLLKIAHEIALCHHERWDGTGYPVRFAGAEIPLSARIVAVADVFDALTHERPYKPAWSIDRSLEQMRMLRGTHFDPELCDAFVELVEGGLLDRIEWE
ncbi:MAG: hypothetical protein NVSMB57_14550 [Actinomycetota bacterium]